MPAEKDGFRDQLENIIAAFPKGECLSVSDVADYTGKDRRLVPGLFPFVGHHKAAYITRTQLARALVAGKPTTKRRT